MKILDRDARRFWNVASLIAILHVALFPEEANTGSCNG